MECLRLQGFRNLEPLDVQPAAGFNVWLGDNGAGKTSLLEAIHFLSRAKSFRTNNLDRVIQKGSERAWVAGRHAGHQLGVERRPGATRLRLNGTDIRGRSRLAERLPVQLITTEHQRLLLDGPAIRRSFLDWGAFHVERDHHAIAHRYQQALQQRNAAIRQADTRAAVVWTETLAESAERLEANRMRFFHRLETRWNRLMESWLPSLPLAIRYQRGTGSAAAWSDVFEESAPADWEVGFSRNGPHRADLLIQSDGRPARDILSRGQQKLAIIALLLAEVEVWMEHEPPPLLLVDDLPAELDTAHLTAVWRVMAGYNIQAHVTAIDLRDLPLADTPSARIHRLIGGRAHPVGS